MATPAQLERKAERARERLSELTLRLLIKCEAWPSLTGLELERLSK
jgi:hypothetical protein